MPTAASALYGSVWHWPAHTAAQRAAEEGLSRPNVALALALLIRPGYIVFEQEGRHRYHRFTRAGEDWLLSLLTGMPASLNPRVI